MPRGLTFWMVSKDPPPTPRELYCERSVADSTSGVLIGKT